MTTPTFPSVSLPAMNALHEREAERIGRVRARIAEARAGRERRQAIGDALAVWLAEVREHFAREEQWMREAGFGPYALHRGEHHKALRELEALVRSWHHAPDLDRLAVFVDFEWPLWMEQHIISFDATAAQYLAHRVRDADG